MQLSSVMATQMLECARYVFQLRVGLSGGDTAQVTSALRWFRGNYAKCPAFIQEEAKSAYIHHEGHVLELSFKKALEKGKGLGSRGNMDYSTVKVLELEALLERASEVHVSL